MTVDVVGAPFDLCGLRLGSRLGPEAVRLAGLAEAFGALGIGLSDPGDLRLANQPSNGKGLRNFRPLLKAVRAVRAATSAAIRKGSVPLMMGGEHTLSAGSVAAAIEHFGSGLGVVWIDAHADLNTPGSSLTGNIHGMPLAALQGLASEASGATDAQWKELLNALGPGRLDPMHVAHIGLRDVDRAERARLAGPAITMAEIDLQGILAAVDRLGAWWTEHGLTRIWVSFDVDALDPILAPGTGTAVRGGLSYREAHLLAELLHARLLRDQGVQLAGVDLVEVNPLHDRQNETALMAVEWLASLFGKTILA
jgi:arginase